MAIRELIVAGKFAKTKLNSKTKIFCLDDLNVILNNHNLIYPYVRVSNFKNSTSRLDLVDLHNNKYLNSLQNKLSKKKILYRLAKGDTLIIDSMDVLNEALRKTAAKISSALSAKTTCNLYYTFKNNVGINLHFDNHDVLAFQLHGRKQWNIVLDKIEDVSQGIIFSGKPDLKSSRTKLHSVLIEEGEVLFIPKGIWHYTQTLIDQSSLHIAFGLEPPTKRDLINLFLKEMFEMDFEKNLYGLTRDEALSFLHSYFDNEFFYEKFNEECFGDFVEKFKNKYETVSLS